MLTSSQTCRPHTRPRNWTSQHCWEWRCTLSMLSLLGSPDPSPKPPRAHPPALQRVHVWTSVAFTPHSPPANSQPHVRACTRPRPFVPWLLSAGAVLRARPRVRGLYRDELECGARSLSRTELFWGSRELERACATDYCSCSVVLSCRFWKLTGVVTAPQRSQGLRVFPVSPESIPRTQIDLREACLAYNLGIRLRCVIR